MSESIALNKKIEEDESVLSAEYDASENTLTVTHDPSSDGGGMVTEQLFHGFSEQEVTAIREGKLTPIRADGDSTTYRVHITIDEQKENRVSKFNFSV